MACIGHDTLDLFHCPALPPKENQVDMPGGGRQGLRTDAEFIIWCVTALQQFEYPDPLPFCSSVMSAPPPNTASDDFKIVLNISYSACSPSYRRCQLSVMDRVCGSGKLNFSAIAINCYCVWVDKP